MPNSCTASTPRPASGSERPTWLPVRTSLSRRRPRGSFTLICTCCGASSSRDGLLRLVAFGVVQEPLGILRPLVVDVRRPAVQRNAAVRVLFHQAAVVINDRAVQQAHPDILAIGQAHFRSLVHCAKHITRQCYDVPIPPRREYHYGIAA